MLFMPRHGAQHLQDPLVQSWLAQFVAGQPDLHGDLLHHPRAQRRKIHRTGRDSQRQEQDREEPAGEEMPTVWVHDSQDRLEG